MGTKRQKKRKREKENRPKETVPPSEVFISDGR
jgi:hypothetical protein